MADYVPLQITLNSAAIFQTPRYSFTKPRVYGVVSLVEGSSVTRHKTPVDKHGGVRPFWDFRVRFLVDESKLQDNSAMLVFQLRRCRAIGDKDVGCLYVPLKDLFDTAGGKNRLRPAAFLMASRSGKPKGVVYLSYLFDAANACVSPNNYTWYFSGQIIPVPYSETKSYERVSGMVKKGGERLIGHPAVSSVPPCLAPSAPYLPVDGCFPANPAPSAPYIEDLC